MNEIIKNFIFEQTFNCYNHACYSRTDLEGFIADLNEEIELALDCYYRFDDEERDPEIVQRAWDMYITVREYNISVINGIKKVLRESEVIK
jgi:hypothetical protein